MQPSIPAIEVTHDADAASVRRPHRERDSIDPVDRLGVRPQLLPQPLVPAFSRQVQIELAERGEERIGILLHERLSIRVADLDLVPLEGILDDALEEPGFVDPLKLCRELVVYEDAHRLGPRTPCPDDRAALHRMPAQQAVRISQLASDEPVDVRASVRASRRWTRRHVDSPRSITRAMPRRGMRAQSGRWRRS